MFALENPIRPYAWGSRTAIPELLGVAPTDEPQAELWMGAHPSSPSLVQTGAGRRSLLELIQADPVGELGALVYAEFGPRLPFLLKLLAAEQPLSLQAHPTPEQARDGFERENAAGIAIDAANRNYKDAYAKPELIVALTPFEAMAGFRPVDQALAAARRIGVPDLLSLFAPLESLPPAEGVRAVFTALMTAPRERRTQLLPAVLTACQPLAAAGDGDARLVGHLAAHYPDDIGVVAALLLNHVVLQPGQAIYLPAGNMHAYVRGLGVEVLANSDNVLRGGLTSKHVDLPELTHVLDFTPATLAIQQPDTNSATADPGEAVYPTPAREFRLSRVEVSATSAVGLSPRGAQILLCVDGAVRVDRASTAGANGGPGTDQGKPIELVPGRSVYAGAGCGAVTLSGHGTVFRATAGLQPAPGGG